MLKGFRQFLLKGNALDLAAGVVIGAAFTSFVNSIVKGMITPVIGSIIRADNFSDLYFRFHGSKFMYGDVFNSFISFIIVAAVVYYLIVRPKNFLVRKSKKALSDDPEKKKCPECLSEIPKEATRCAYCTAKLS